VPVLLSLVVEPLTGVVDTAFVARLGAAPLAALGAATMLLSSVFWIFNFLGIGTQTEVALGSGLGGSERAREAASLALALSLAIGAALALCAWPLLPSAARLMSEDPAIQDAMASYLGIRLLGAPAVLLILTGFGALRGLQDMRTPLWVAAGANAVNVALDPLLIFGLGPLPALGIAGAAWASVAAQWLGALWSVGAVRRRLGLAPQVPWRLAPALFVVGRDLLLRTGLLSLFLLLATRTATQLGADSGAAHQAVRQVWLFAAFLLDAYAATAQSLVAYFLGAGRAALARRVAALACGWGVGTGLVLAAVMWLGEGAVARLLVPDSARPVFHGAWLMLALAQPLNALSFVTDGIHWGTKDYRYLRNVMLAATGSGLLLLLSVPGSGPRALTLIWAVTAAWIGVRAAFGVLRIWPGLGASPLADRLRCTS
jgi:MATE family multidrug resistance protein